MAELQTEPGAQRDVIVPVRASAHEDPPPSEPSRDRTEPALRDPHPFGQAQTAPEIMPAPRHRFHFTADAELLEFVERLRGLLRHKIPDGRLENIFKEAAKMLLSHLERDKRALPTRAARPPAPPVPATPIHSKTGRGESRTVPRAVKRAVWTRDDGRCAYTAPDGSRCESRDALEYDHMTAWADGGRSDTQDNIRLLCRTHNQRLGRLRFGPRPAVPIRARDSGAPGGP